MRGESFVKNLLKFGVVLLLYMNIGALNVLAQEDAVNGPNIDTVINGIAFDCYDLGTTTHIDPYGLVATQNQLQWAIDNGEVAMIKNNGLTAYFGHNWEHIRGINGDLLHDGIFSLIRDLKTGDVIEQDGKRYIVRDEIFFTQEQSDVGQPGSLTYRGYDIGWAVYYWPFHEDAVSVQFCVEGGMKLFFAYPS